MNWPRWMLNHLPADCDPRFHVYCVKMKLYFGHATHMWNLLDRFCDPNNILVDGFEFVDEFKHIQINNLLFDSGDFVNQTFNPVIYDDHIALPALIQNISRHKPSKKRSKYQAKDE